MKNLDKKAWSRTRRCDSW